MDREQYREEGNQLNDGVLRRDDDERNVDLLLHMETANVEQVVDTGQRDALKNEESESDGNCFYLTLATLVLVVGVVIIVVMLVVVKDDDDGISQPDPPTPAPTEAIIMISDPQDRLNALLVGVGNNQATRTYLDGRIPTAASSLTGISADSDPVTLAAAWVVHTDSFHAEREILQRFALAVLYYTTAGDKWLMADGWLQNSSFCNGWTGLTCCRDYFPDKSPQQCYYKEPHELVAVDLASNNLTGPIPEAFALLHSVEVLSLEGNHLTGGLDPLVIGSMASLDTLYINHNSLSGTISGAIRANGKLDTFYAHGNNFTGTWPNEFCEYCKDQGICVSRPISFSLDCDKIRCPLGCCPGNQPRIYCYGRYSQSNSGDDDDDEEDEEDTSSSMNTTSVGGV